MNCIGSHHLPEPSPPSYCIASPLCPAAQATRSQCDMAEELSRQLEDILSTYCRESMSDDASSLANGQSHSPELNGLNREDDKQGESIEQTRGGQKEQKKSQDKKKVKGLGKDLTFSLLPCSPTRLSDPVPPLWCSSLQAKRSLFSCRL